MKQGLPKLAALACADLLAFIAATGAALLCLNAPLDGKDAPDLLVAIAVFLGTSAVMGLYRNTWPQTKPELDSVRELRAQVLATITTLLASLAFQEIADHENAVPPWAKVTAAAFLIPGLILARHLIRHLLNIPKNAIVLNGTITVPHEETNDLGLFLPVARTLKQVIEITLAAAMMVLCLPLFALIAALVKLTSAGPALYFSPRIGKNGKTFRMVKFRTMTEKADEQLTSLTAHSSEMADQWTKQFKLQQDPRITPLGKILRKTSLDELPQLWNVITGNMAIIGPRPVVAEEISRYGQHVNTLVSVKPGITGLWQVSGRNDLTYPQRVLIDVFYVQHWSPWLDLFIILKTIIEVLSAHGR